MVGQTNRQTNRLRLQRYIYIDIGQYLLWILLPIVIYENLNLVYI